MNDMVWLRGDKAEQQQKSGSIPVFFAPPYPLPKHPLRTEHFEVCLGTP
jgi:hypothetical protein